MSSIYQEAAVYCRKLLENNRGSTVVGDSSENDGSKSTQLALKVLVYKSVIESTLQQAAIDLKTLKIDDLLAMVMLYDSLFGAGKIQGGGEVKRKLMTILPALLTVRDQMMVAKSSSVDLLDPIFQQALALALHLRVNTALTSRKQAHCYLTTKYPQHTLTNDELIDNLIIINPVIDNVGADEWVIAGKLIPQDKASCFPAQVLSNHLSSTSQTICDIIDACAAPGNKTSHLSALLPLGSRVFAFEQHTNRCNQLSSRLATILNDPQQEKVVIQQADFLSINSMHNPQLGDVRGILLDPSCSGSGIIRGNTGLHRLIEKHVNSSYHELKQRLRGLQAFQQRVVKHAMVAFPTATAIVYSTCSVHAMENEQVVEHTLQYSINHSLGWKLVMPPGFDSWQRRGVLEDSHALTEEQCNMLIRCTPEDGMNGFFVALFVRDSDVEVDVDKSQQLLQEQEQQSTVNKNNKRQREEQQTSSSHTSSTHVDPTKKVKQDRESALQSLARCKEKKEAAANKAKNANFFGKVMISNRKMKKFNKK